MAYHNANPSKQALLCVFCTNVLSVIHCRSTSVTLLSHGCGRVAGVVHRPLELLRSAVLTGGCQRGHTGMVNYTSSENKPTPVSPCILIGPVLVNMCDQGFWQTVFCSTSQFSLLISKIKVMAKSQWLVNLCPSNPLPLHSKETPPENPTRRLSSWYQVLCRRELKENCSHDSRPDYLHHCMLQLYGRRAAWEDPVEWVLHAYPWCSNNSVNLDSLLKLRPEDVGYDVQGTTTAPATAKTGPNTQTSDNDTDPLVGYCELLLFVSVLKLTWLPLIAVSRLIIFYALSGINP